MKIAETTMLELMDKMGETYVEARMREGATEEELKEDIERIEATVRGAFERFCQYVGINKVIMEEEEK